MRPRPDYMAAARDELARRADREHPGWTFTHGRYGWTATCPGQDEPLRSSSLPGLTALIGLFPAWGRLRQPGKDHAGRARKRSAPPI
jgi:hypothetical protein